MNQRATLFGLLLRIAYEFHRHRLLGIPMDWLTVASSLLAGLILLRNSELVWGGALVGFAAASLLLMGLARRVDYLIFRPGAHAQPEAAHDDLAPDHEVSVRATGPFAVRGQQRYLVEHLATYTTPHSREHILMTQLTLSRLLLVGKSDPEVWGWWYQFFRPEQIESVQMGQAVHGWHVRPAIKVTYWVEDDKERQHQVETILSFDSRERRSLVWSDLTREQRRADATP